MEGNARSLLLLTIIALFISFASSYDGRSYLSVLQSHSPETTRQPQPKENVQIPFRPTSFRRSNGYNRQDRCNTDYKFDYIQLTLQWAPGTCATSPQQCKRSENKLFTIHGMWPTVKHTQLPAFCCFDNTFDYNLIEPLLPELNKYWFSYYDSNSRGFWSHEWLKHGTCLKNVKQLQGEKLFFSNTLNIVKNLPILESLAQAGIVPDDKKPYNSVDIQNALKKLSGGMRNRIDCDLEAHQPIPLLTGLSFCYDSNLKFTDCPPSKSRCQRQVLFLSR